MINILVYKQGVDWALKYQVRINDEQQQPRNSMCTN